jgi:HK97 gp10 family phage protein
MVPEVKDQVPIDTGLTRESVKVRAVKARKRGVIALDVRIAASTAGLKKTSTTTGDTVFYPAVVEYGRAGVPPDPFMRRAFQAAGKSARNAALDEIRSGIEKEARRR